MTAIAQTEPGDRARPVSTGARTFTPVAAALLWPPVAWGLLETAQAGMMASVIVFLVLPSIALAVERPSVVPSALAFSVIVGGASIAWIDDLATRNGQWLVLEPLSALPLIDASAQSMFWAVAHFFISVLAWERIMERTTGRVPRLTRVALSAGAAIAVLAAFVCVRSWAPAWTSIPYFYLGFGVSLILAPVVVTCVRRPRLLRPLVLLAAVGFYWKAIYEIAALRSDWWRFPGEFVGWVELPGYRIPVEELVFWILLFSPAISVFWEFWNGSGDHEIRHGQPMKPIVSQA